MQRRHSAIPVWLLPFALLAIGAFGPTSAPAEGHGRRGPPPLERILERNADRLGLDQATRVEIERIAEASRPEGRMLRDQLRALHDEMRSLLDQDTPDEAAVMGQAERIGEAEVAMQKHRLRTMLQIRALLTPDQRRELVRIHEERREERDAEPRGYGPGEPPPP